MFPQIFIHMIRKAYYTSPVRYRRDMTQFGEFKYFNCGPIQDVCTRSMLFMCCCFVVLKIFIHTFRECFTSIVGKYVVWIQIQLITRWVDGTPTTEVTRSLSGRSLHLTLVTKWSRSHMTLKIQISRSWPRSNPLSNLRPRVQNDMFAFRFVAIGPFLVEI